MSDGMLVEKDLLLVSPQLLGDPVEVDDAVVNALLVGVVLADPQAFGDGLQALFQEVHLQLQKGS